MKYLSFILLVFICVLSLSSCIKEKEEEYPKPEKDLTIGDQVPAFIVYEKDNYTGSFFDSKELAGKTTVLVFFNTECKDCQRERPKIDKVWEELQEDETFQLITIARDQTKEESDGFWSSLTIPKYIDPERKVFSLFAGSTVPRIYLIDKNAKIVWMAVEVLTLEEDELVDLVRQYY